jgi:hypothetical protein
MNPFRSFRGLFAPILLLVALSGFAPQSAGFPGFVGVRPAILGGGPAATLSYLIVGGGASGCDTGEGGGNGGNVLFSASSASPSIGSYTVVVGGAGSPGGNSSWNGLTATGAATTSCPGGGTSGTNAGTYSITGVGASYGTAGPDDGFGFNRLPNTGQGGSTPGADGAAGVVIIRYVTGSQTWTGCTITTVGPDTVHTCTAGATLQRTA